MRSPNPRESGEGGARSEVWQKGEKGRETTKGGTAKKRFAGAHEFEKRPTKKVGESPK